MVRWCIEIFFELYPCLRPSCSRFKKKVGDFLKGLFAPLSTDELLRRLNKNDLGVKYQVIKDETGLFKVVSQTDTSSDKFTSKMTPNFKDDMQRLFNREDPESIKPTISAEKAKELFLLGYRFSRAWVYMHNPGDSRRWLLFKRHLMENSSDIYIENGKSKATGAWGYCTKCDFRNITDGFFPFPAPNKVDMVITICADLFSPPNLNHAKQQYDYLMKQEEDILIDILISAQQK